MTADDIRQSILEKLECEFIEILGEDGTHFEGTIVSGLFEGLNRVKQHQMVFNALG
ncbi:MAG: BolA/IbaG family iron-sulfur metabolism protein, partial [Candidatus Methylopumilus sp.]